MINPRVIVLCNSNYAFPALQQLNFFNQLAVVVIPEQYLDILASTKYMFTGSGVPVISVSKKNYVQQLTDLIDIHAVNTGLVLSFDYKIPPSVFQLPANGFFNLHAGLLPGYRGPDPVFQQIRNKEKHAGVTLHKLDEDYNTGPVVVSDKLKLYSGDTYGMVVEKLSYSAAKLAGTLLKLIAFELVVPSKPQVGALAVYYKKQCDSDTTINWEVMDSDSIVCLINACNPWNKGAITRLNNKKIHLLEASQLPNTSATDSPPGLITCIDERGIIVTAINNHFVCIRVIYSDEGFFAAGKLKQFGIIPGTRFK